ncbi:cytochrome b562 [Vibrio tritonius]|uniref:Cytochrome b562 n=1 Tax=Vibrio tritonius TaxID=1435069 RepID=A0ABS7YSW8_9VIBR|nr:cytochrome b562 [Vibrio tritonius]MCA2017375.1 cytochrome b562 [Vibrio tritonius]
MIRAMTVFLIGITMASSVWAHGDLGDTMKQMKSAFRDAAQAKSVASMKAAVADLSTLVEQSKHHEYDGDDLTAYHKGLQELTQALDTVQSDLDNNQLEQAKNDLRKVDDLRREYHKKTR